MNGYTEFYYLGEDLIVHTECYHQTARHYTDCRVEKGNVEKLKRKLGCDEDIVKFLTKRYSNGIGILDVLKENGVSYEVVERGYEDTSTDV